MKKTQNSPIAQSTIASSVILDGVGIHGGEKVRLTLKPAAANTGIVFLRTDCDVTIPANIAHLGLKMDRATGLSHQGVTIQTPEHLLAACYGLGIDNLVVELNAQEIPIMDGSAKPFVEAIVEAGIRQYTDATQTPLICSEPITLSYNDQRIIVLPSDQFMVTYVLDYQDSFVGSQVYTFTMNEDAFTQDIAPARTYGFRNEVEGLLKRGLAKGGTLENAVVIGETDYLTPLRFPNELARHKILDMIGDLALLGQPLLAHVIGIRSGHHLNTKLVKKLGLLN